MRKTALILLILISVSAFGEPVVTPELAVSPLRQSAPHGWRHPHGLAASPHGFVTFWTDPHRNGALVMARFTPDGELLDPDGVPVDLPGWTLRNAEPMWNGSEYLLQAEATRTGSNTVERILVRMRFDGTFVGEPVPNRDQGEYFVSNNGVLMMRGYDSAREQWFFARAAADGTVIEPTITRIASLGGQMVAFAGHNDDVVVLVSTERASEVIRVRLGAGVVARMQIAPRFVFGTFAANASDVGLVWVEEFPPVFASLRVHRIWFSRVDAGGFAFPPVLLDSITSSYGVSPAIVWNGSTFVIAWDAIIPDERSLIRVTTSADPSNVRDLSRHPIWSSTPLLAAGTRTLLLTREAEGEYVAHTQLLARAFDDVSALGSTSPAVPIIRRGVPDQYSAMTAVHASGGMLVLWGEWDGTRRLKTRFFPRSGNAGVEVALPYGDASPRRLVAVNDGFVALLFRYDDGWQPVIQRFDRNGTALDSFTYPRINTPPDASLAGGGEDALFAWRTNDGVHASRIPLRGTTTPEVIHIWPTGSEVEVARGASGDFVTWVERAPQPVLFARVHMARVPKAGEGVAIFGNVWVGERLHAHRTAAHGDEMLLLTKAQSSGSCVEGRRISLADGKQIGGTTNVDCTDNDRFIPMWAHGSWWTFFGSRGNVPGSLLDLGSDARELVRTVTLERADMIAPLAVPAPNGFVITFTRAEPAALYASRAYLQRVLLDGRQRVVRH